MLTMANTKNAQRRQGKTPQEPLVKEKKPRNPTVHVSREPGLHVNKVKKVDARQLGKKPRQAEGPTAKRNKEITTSTTSKNGSNAADRKRAQMLRDRLAKARATKEAKKQELLAVQKKAQKKGSAASKKPANESDS